MVVALHLLHLLLAISPQAATPQIPWVLAYHCDSGWGEMTEDVCGSLDFSDRERNFATRQEAVDWINANYVFAPSSLRHGSRILSCAFNYIDAASDDLWRSHQKEVDCDTKEKLMGRFDDDNGDGYSD
jgi:hypothetical protein